MSRAPTLGGIDLSGVTALATALSHLETIRYAQYDGEIQPFTGLTRPRLTIEVKLGPDAPPLACCASAIRPVDGLSLRGRGRTPSGPGVSPTGRVLGRPHPVW